MADTLGTRITSKLAARDFTLEQLSQRTAVSLRVLNMVIAEVPDGAKRLSLRDMGALAKWLGTTVEWLRNGGEVSAPAATVITCTRTTARCSCGGRLIGTCGYALHGKREGHLCGAQLCERCANRPSLLDPALLWCGPHARWDAEKRKAGGAKHG